MHNKNNDCCDSCCSYTHKCRVINNGCAGKIIYFNDECTKNNVNNHHCCSSEVNNATVK